MADALSALRAQLAKMAPLSIVPFVIPAPLSGLASPVRMGRGVLVRVTQVATGVDFTITHNLGFTPSAVLPIDNGTTFTPKTKRGATAWSSTTITIQVDTTCPAPGCWMFVF